MRLSILLVRETAADLKELCILSIEVVMALHLDFNSSNSAFNDSDVITAIYLNRKREIKNNILKIRERLSLYSNENHQKLKERER